MGQNYGEVTRYDPNFNGPTHNRSCTDILWLIIFILFLGVWGFVGFYGIKYGNIEKLLAPVDSQGKRCGLDSGLEDKKYLMFFSITKCLSPDTALIGCPTPQVCVKDCPTRSITFTPENFNAEKANMMCIDEVDKSTLTTYEIAKPYMDADKCTRYILKSQPVLGRCFVNVADVNDYIASIASDLESMNETQILEQLIKLTRFDQLSAQIVQDLQQSRWYLLGALFVVLILCFIYILLLRWVVGPVVWISILGLLGLLGFCTYLSYVQYEYFRDNPVNLNVETNLLGFLRGIFSKKETWLAVLIIVAVVLVILTLIVVFLRSRITIAIGLIKEGSKAVTAIKSTIFFPILPWILQLLVIGYGVIVFMSIMSLGDSAFRVVNLKQDTSCVCTQEYQGIQDYMACVPARFTQLCRDGNSMCQNATCHFAGLEGDYKVGLLHLANLLGFFWTMFFISGVSDMMLASTFSTWYWTFEKKNIPFFTLTSGVFRTLRYHLGTVAFGALIIAIVRVIRVILEYIDHKLKKFDNPITKCLLCLCKCCCWCLENFLKFINKNAYIMCAVHGQNFCKSARDAFSLLMRNIVRVVVLDKLTDFLFFLSKVLISIGVGLAVHYLLQWKTIYEITMGQPLHYSYIPAVILSVATYLICTIFFNVYQMAIDTLFLCFLEDCERNDGSPEKPYFMSKNLMKILGKKNKKTE